MTTTAIDLQPLEKTLRKKLESAVKDARDVVEEAARAACTQLGVGNAEPDEHLSEEERDLRRRLRIHGRQLGDQRNATKKTQEIDRLVEEVAYQHWHRMLFARFLAENNLLMYPDPDDPVPISLEECEDLAADEGAKNGWELAARYATKMLPQIFRVDSPVFALTLPPEKQQRLESLLSDLPTEVFTASDSLGWVYQFWQAKRKDEVNASEVKIGARELPAVTQLFTEPYMVSFLLDNSLGAWWAGKRLTDDDLRTASSEQELRDKLSLPGVPLEYLRFVRTETTAENSDLQPPTSDLPPWTPAAGTFDAWPESLSELKTLDPCCGSGHFLVAALLMLTPMRMELEGLSASEAVDRVLSENLHGLEIDQRCVELAAFALALAAWRFPSGDKPGGYRVLPDLNVACSGLSVSLAKEEWKELAKGNNQLKIALDFMYDEFKDAPVLGSLLNPVKSNLPAGITWADIAPMLEEIQMSSIDLEKSEIAVVAHGLARAATLLSSGYHSVFTNVPYLARGKHGSRLREFCEKNYPAGMQELATVFSDRCLELCAENGTCALVLPHNWLFLTIYRKFREKLFKLHSWHMVARLGPGAFDTLSGEVVKVILILMSRGEITTDLLNVEDEPRLIRGLDVSESRAVEVKATQLVTDDLKTVEQSKQLENPEARLIFDELSNHKPLSEFADALMGVSAGDGIRFHTMFWEIGVHGEDWECLQGSVSEHVAFSGRNEIILWENETGQVFELAQSVKHLNHSAQNWQRGRASWGRKGVVISQMGDLPATIYYGQIYDSNCCAIVPFDQANLTPLWCFATDFQFHDNVRQLNQALKVSPGTFLEIGFDLAHWQQVASEKYPHGLPEPYSDDPTQWLFHGHPASSTDVLQVAVARLLGYRWPAELDAEMELATDARAWVARSSQLFDGSDNDTADDDGIVCIPAVGTEQPAEDRLLNLLHRAYEDGRAQEQVFRDKLDAADENDPVTVDLWRRGYTSPSPQPSPQGERENEWVPDSFPAWRDSLLEAVGHTGKTLESWLRDKFFSQHMKLFHHRPFIWHIWDGLKDGFSVLVNYHKLDNKLLETLIYTYLNDWINKQKNSSEDGHEERLAAAESLKLKLEKILEGESPHDIFVRWKPLSEQPIGWNPDLNDGVRLNIRPWMTVGDVKKKGAGVLRDKPNCKWTKDRGKDVESAPWYHLGPEYGEKVAARINDHHLTLEEKKAAQ